VPTVPATTPVTTPATTPGAPTNEVIFTSPDEGWVCADTLFHTADGGRTWQAVDYRQVPGTGPSHSCGAADHNAWIVSDSVVVPVQGGTDVAGPVTFPTALPEDTTVKVTFADKTHGWVLAVPNGTGRGTLYRSTNGIGFSVVSRDAPTGQVQFADANNGWGIDAGGLKQTTDGGATWQPEGYGVPLTSEGPSFLNDIDVEGSTVVVAGGVSGGNFYEPFFDVSLDGGRTWTTRVDKNMSFAGTLDIDLAVVDGDDWRVVTGNRLWLTDDGGRTWVSRELPGSAGPATSLSFPTTEIGWTIVDDRVVQTTDAGRSWHAVDTTPQRPWQTGLASVPGECTSDPTTPPSDADPRAAAIAAAQDFVRRTRGWIGAHVLEAEPASGKPKADGYAGIIQSNVTRYCGAKVANATYAVTLDNDSITLDNSHFTVLAVGHFADGWSVWGYYR
jgi:photosystem II stability/assembly factor-like uncharacterized protein